MAAAAALQSMKRHRILGNPLHRNQSHSGRDKHFDEAECQKERDFVAHYKGSCEIVSPEQIGRDPRNKELGGSSRSLRVQDFQLIQTIGTGTFARVWLVKLTNPAKEDQDKVFALKILRKVDIIRLKQVEHVKNERSTLGAVAGHPFITTLITTFADHDCLYMLLDYCPGGEVFTYLRRAQKFDEETSRFYAAEIVLVLEFLHDTQRVAYRDLKPENILIDSQGHLKLVDFGFAKKIENAETYTLCGTPEYLAPEVIRNSGHGYPVDWWAFGILLYEFLVGQPPFWDSNPMRIYNKIVECKISFPSSISPAAESLINALIVKDPSRRLGTHGSKEIKAHEFFKNTNWDDLYYRRSQGPIIPNIKNNADTSCFDSYDQPDGKKSGSNNVYTKEMESTHEASFKEF